MADIEALIVMDERERMVPADPVALRDAVCALVAELGAVSELGPRLVLLRRIGSGLTALGGFAVAQRVLGEALELACGLGDPRAEVAARINLGDALRYAGDLQAAAAQYEPALALARRAVPDRVDFALQHYGKHLLDAGRTEQAVACLREAMRLRQAKGDKDLIESTRRALAMVARRELGSNRNDAGLFDRSWMVQYRVVWDTAVVIVRDEAGRVLLVEQNYGHRFFGLPGGKVESGETLREAAVRETAEETGLVVTVGERVWFAELVYPGGAEYRAHAFVADSVAGEPAAQDEEISSVGWYGLTALPHPLTPSAAAFLPRLVTVEGINQSDSPD